MSRSNLSKRVGELEAARPFEYRHPFTPRSWSEVVTAFEAAVPEEEKHLLDLLEEQLGDDEDREGRPHGVEDWLYGVYHGFFRLPSQLPCGLLGLYLAGCLPDRRCGECRIALPHTLPTWERCPACGSSAIQYSDLARRFGQSWYAQGCGCEPPVADPDWEEHEARVAAVRAEGDEAP